MNREQLKEIIGTAIQEEIESHDFYFSAAKKVRDDSIKELFEDLAADELEHKKYLEEFLSSDAEVIKLKDVDDYKVAETIEKPVLSTDMNFSDALKLAIKREEEAMEMYEGLSNACDEQEMRDVFLGLVQMETMHKTRLEDIFLNVGYREVW